MYYLKSKLTRRPLYKQFAQYMYLKSQLEKSLVVDSHLVLCFRYGASMIAGLVSYHDWVGVQIVEDTLEHVRIGNLFLSKINFDVFLFFIFWKIEFKKKTFLLQVWKWTMPNTINDDWLWLNLWESYTIIASLTPLLSLRYDLLFTTHINLGN